MIGSLEWAWNWLSDRPFDGETTVFDLLAIVGSLAIGGYAGARTIAVSRVNAEARRELYEGVLRRTVTHLPRRPELCAEWDQAMTRTDHLVQLLSWPERAGWATLNLFLPGHRTLPAAASVRAYSEEPGVRQWDAAEEAQTDWCYSMFLYHYVQRLDRGRHSDDIDEEERMYFSGLGYEFMSDNIDGWFRLDRLETYVEGRLRPGNPWRRLRNRALGARMILDRIRTRAPQPGMRPIDYQRF